MVAVLRAAVPAATCRSSTRRGALAARQLRAPIARRHAIVTPRAQADASGDAAPAPSPPPAPTPRRPPHPRPAPSTP
eukprot:jgi/Tetstr1/423252/TSEL_013952.t1